jgi:glycosyltransferase involved in cell wall biosynthesis
MRKILVGFRFKHHHEFSGYQRLVHHVAHDVYVNRDRYDFTSPRFNYRGLSRINWILTHLRDFFFFRRLKKEIMASEGGLVHFLYPENTLAYLPFEIPRSVTVVATFHQPIPYFRKLLSDPNASCRIANYRRCDKLIALSREMEQGMKDLFGFDNVRFIPHGVETEAFPDLELIRKSKSILILGSWLRDFDSLARVLSELNRVDPSVTVTFIAADADRKGVLHRLSGVRTLGGISHDEMVYELNTHSVLLLQYREMTASNSLLEAASTGLPVICNPLPALFDYVVADAFAPIVLAVDSDMKEAAEEIRRLLVDEPLLSLLRSKAKESVQSLNWKFVASEMERFYGDESFLELPKITDSV